MISTERHVSIGLKAEKRDKAPFVTTFLGQSRKRLQKIDELTRDVKSPELDCQACLCQRDPLRSASSNPDACQDMTQFIMSSS